ncbi:hypothetical protein LSAT2_001002 [Lamellibrachia satsuma]|nr:hypothetical protein LSAT2_001002 [Lamellibrachia satsuma]
MQETKGKQTATDGKADEDSAQEPEDIQTASDGDENTIAQEALEQQVVSEDHVCVNITEKPEENAASQGYVNVTQKPEENGGDALHQDYTNTTQEVEQENTAYDYPKISQIIGTREKLREPPYADSIREPRDSKNDPDGYLIASLVPIPYKLHRAGHRILQLGTKN